MINGDFKLHFNINTNNKVREFMDLIRRYGFREHIFEPTQYIRQRIC